MFSSFSEWCADFEYFFMKSFFKPSQTAFLQLRLRLVFLSFSMAFKASAISSAIAGINILVSICVAYSRPKLSSSCEWLEWSNHKVVGDIAGIDEQTDNSRDESTGHTGAMAVKLAAFERATPEKVSITPQTVPNNQ